jgi:hypothetical protein
MMRETYFVNDGQEIIYAVLLLRRIIGSIGEHERTHTFALLK